MAACRKGKREKKRMELTRKGRTERRGRDPVSNESPPERREIINVILMLTGALYENGYFSFKTSNITSTFAAIAASTFAYTSSS